MRVRNMTGANGNDVANQVIIEDGNKLIFQSYQSIICVIEGYGDEQLITLGNDWDYSRTTMKYLSQFLNEYSYPMRGNYNKKEIEKAIKNGKIIYDKELV